jgi:hypothetical protein
MKGSRDRQETRHRIYSLIAFVTLTVIGIITINLLLAVGRRHTARLYHDPREALVTIFARNEEFFRRDMKRYGTLEELVKADKISPEALAGPIEGYRYRVEVATVTSYVVTADPEGPAPPPEAPKEGKRAMPVQPRRSFYVDQTQEVRAELPPRKAGPGSPVIWSPRDPGSR